MPRPPTCLSFRSQSRWSGRVSGWPESSSALFSSAASLLCSRLPQSDCLNLLMQLLRKQSQFQDTQCFFLNSLRQQDFTFETLGQYKNSVTALILYYALASKVKFLHRVVLKGPTSWIVLCRLVLCCDLPQTFWVFLWHLRWTKPCFLLPLTLAPNHRNPQARWLSDPAGSVQSISCLTVLTSVLFEFIFHRVLLCIKFAVRHHIL